MNASNESPDGQPAPRGRVTKSGKYRLLELKDVTAADLANVDWSRAGEELPREDLLEIIETMKEGEDPAQMEKAYLELIANQDQLGSLSDLITELESGDDTRSP